MFDLSFFNLAKSKKILVVGDVMLDKFYRSKVNRFASDAPVPVAKIISREASPGGAANVARCLAQLGTYPFLAGFVGEDHNCESLMELLYRHHIDSRGLIFSDHPTTTKIRVIANAHQVFRLDFDDDEPYNDSLFDKLRSFVHKELNHSLDAVVIADYEKGVCTERFCHDVISDSHSRGVPVIVLPYGSNWIKYQFSDLIVANVNKINRVLLSPIDPSDDDACAGASNYICRKFNISACATTRSEFGLTLAFNDDFKHFSTQKQLLVDPAGAADAATAAFALAVSTGVNLNRAANLSNIVAGIAVSKPGSYAPTSEDVINFSSNVRVAS